MCVNVVEEQGNFSCAVHPLRNGGEEVRVRYCNTEFLCGAAKEYQEMSDEQKKKYLLFLAEKVAAGMDSYEYSMLNDKDELIAEFRELHERE